MRRKTSAGFTLLEAVIALAVWMILSISIFFVWQYTSERSRALLERQSAFENARGAMDILLVNLQMARSIQLYVLRDTDYTLRRLILPGYYASGLPTRTGFEFEFNINLPPTATTFRRLEFGGNELASNIALVRMQPVGGHMRVTVKTGCEYPIILEGSVDIRYKDLTVTRLAR